MKLKIFAGVALMAGCLVVLAERTEGQATPAVLTIHTGKAVSKVSPTLYGLMTEEINYSYDGGLYAEMVRNRTIRSDWSGVQSWILAENGTSQAAVTVDKATGPSEAISSSLRIEVERADPKNQAGVLNEGYWGMAVRPDTTYKGSFYARAGADIGPVTISLINNQTGKPAATAIVSGLTTGWARYEFSLKSGGLIASANNHLAITVAHPGTLWLNLISLFPPTYRDRANGNRIDLMEKLAAMHPAFLRFPGGNYLEGDHIPERYQWKKTIGPLVDRPTHPSPWHYHSSDGLGLLEFFEWCEDLNMQPVLAVYGGYSMMQEHINPGADLEPYVQDALDEIEYATGDASTTWGARRVKDGHAAPFKLTYVEIGNEDWFDRSGSYEGRYTQYYKAIKAKYPSLQLIATAPIKNMQPDVLDEHYYLRATQFFNDAAHYDKTDRNGPKIFVGEWATREGSPTPNFNAALGDAAWMTGMERNSDIIVMAAYAPLLVNVNPGGMQWDPDLIGYDALRSYGSPSYYGQVMFSKYLGDHTLGSELQLPETPTASGAAVPTSKTPAAASHNGDSGSVNAGSTAPGTPGPKLFYSVTASAAKKQLYLKLVNASSTSQMIDIKFDGRPIAAAGKVISLSAAGPEATNSIEHPTSIVPVESTVRVVSNELRHTMPAWSIQVLQLDQR